MHRFAATTSTCVFAGEGAQCSLNGLYLVAGKDFVDNHTSIDHAVPHGTSRELYKGVLAGEARAVFNGKVIVRPNAQKSDAQQTNKNLLLSARAEIDSKPELRDLGGRREMHARSGHRTAGSGRRLLFEEPRHRRLGGATSPHARLRERGRAAHPTPDALRAAVEAAVLERLEEIFAEEP